MINDTPSTNRNSSVVANPRRGRRGRRLLLLPIMTVACGFNPTFPAGKIQCQRNQDCPPALFCSASLCQPADTRDGPGDDRIADAGAIIDQGATDSGGVPGTDGGRGGGGGANGPGGAGGPTGGGGGATVAGGTTGGNTGGTASNGGRSGTAGSASTGGSGGTGGTGGTGGLPSGSGGSAGIGSGSGGRTGTGGGPATGGAGGSVPVCGNNVIESGETCDRNCPTSCPISGCSRRHLIGSGCTITCVDDPAETRCQSNDGCCPGAARGCNAANDQECAAVCGNSVVESGETCDPPSACQTLAQACLSNQNMVQTPTGDVAACTFRCNSMSRGCVGGDGFCPTGCSRPTDADCPKEAGEMCGAAGECRLGFCANTVCCDRACTGACEACNRSGKVGVCSLPDMTVDADNCGSCGGACSNNNMATRVCSGSACTGMCATGFGDCNTDKRTDGCETDTTSNPNHCGICGTVCRYGSCQTSTCAFTRHGFFSPGASSANRFSATMYCHRIHTTASGRLAALGINVGVNATAGIPFRLALYTSSSDAPLTLLGQTSDLASVSQAPVESLFSAPTLASADYWLCMLTSATLRVTTEGTLTGPVYSGAFVAGTFPATAPVLTRAASDPLITNVYIVTTP